MKKILLMGNGAREHVIAETLKRSPQGCEIFVFGKAVNPGLKALAKEYAVGSFTEFSELKTFAEKCQPDFAFIGPDNPIADGAVDALLELGIESVAPLQSLARLESSKSFARDLLKKYDIPGNPKFQVFSDETGAREYMEKLGEYVVKSDGLHGGKGVKVSGEHLANFDEGMEFVRSCLEADGRVVIEEKFVGQEFSYMSFADSSGVVDMPAVQDHKRAFEGDTGPNTGGMGTWSDADHSLPFLKPSDLEEAHAITVAVAKALKEETGHSFRGIMYGGFIAVKDGVRLIEYNARFGDPEAMNVLPLLKTDFIEVCEAMIAGRLNEMKLEFENKATVVKYLVPEGYPASTASGEKIEVGDVPDGVRMYFASVNERGGEIFLSSSRAIAFVGIGDTIAEAEALAQSAASCVKGPVFYRADIGTEPLIQKRLDHMKSIRTSS